MGFRTLVLLHNDDAHMWSKDPELGQKIFYALSNPEDRDFYFGSVVECEHCDTQTVAVVDSYNFRPLVFSHWRAGETQQETDERLLRELAQKLGYKVIRQKHQKLPDPTLWRGFGTALKAK